MFKDLSWGIKLSFTEWFHLFHLANSHTLTFPSTQTNWKVISWSTILSFWAPASHMSRIMMIITIDFVKNLLFDYTMLFEKHNLIEVLIRVKEIKAPRGSHGSWMTELGFTPELTDSRAITLLIFLVETWPLLFVENRACLTVCSLIHPERRPPITQQSLFICISSVDPRKSSGSLLIQATQLTPHVDAVLPFISSVIKG